MRKVAKGLFSLAVAALIAACAPQHVTTNSDRTAVQQLVQSEAAGRTISRLELPPLRGRTVVLQVASIVGDVAQSTKDEEYLRQLVTTALEWKGARVVEKEKDADFIVRAFFGAFGTTETRSFVGLPQTQSIVVPVTTPEVALYKAVTQKGFAKAKLVIFDRELNRVIHSDGPVQSETYWHEFSILGINFRRTDTSWKPGLQRAVSNYVDGE